jgi:hypothetical protein
MPENAWHKSFVPALAARAIVRTQVRRVTEVTERENHCDRLLSGGHEDHREHTGADRVEPGREADERLHFWYRGQFAWLGSQAFRWFLYRSQSTAAQSIDSGR